MTLRSLSSTLFSVPFLVRVPWGLQSRLSLRVFTLSTARRTSFSLRSFKLESDISTKMTENDSATEGAEPVASELIDAYHYLSRDPKCPEHNKINLHNINKFVDVGSLKKLFRKENLEFSRIKKSRHGDRAFISFASAEHKEKALNTLNGYKFKGRILEAVEGKPMEDPFIKRRNEQGARQLEGTTKRPKVIDIDPNIPPLEQVADRVCPLWRVPYDDQLITKRGIVVTTLRNIARKLKKMPLAGDWLNQATSQYAGLPCELLDTVPSPLIDEYRTKCEFTIGTGPDGTEKTIGFRLGSYSDGSITVVEPTLCRNVPEVAKTIARHMQDYLKESPLSNFCLITHQGAWRQLLVRSTSIGQSLAVLYIQDKHIDQETLTNECNRLKIFAEEVGMPADVIMVQVDNSASCMDTNRPPPIMIKGKQPFISEKLLDLEFRISPDSFFQVNTPGAEVLYSLIGDWCQFSGEEDEVLLDMCCGTGTIGQTLAGCVAHVIGIEMVEDAVEDARSNAELNGISNVTYIVGKAEDTIKDVMKDPTVAQALRRCEGIQKLIYVSCNLKGASQNIIDFCRPESKRWSGQPFKIVRAIPMDMFPHTDHCEIRSSLSSVGVNDILEQDDAQGNIVIYDEK
eukprot:gene2022-5095_t